MAISLPSWLRFRPITIPDGGVTAAPILDYLSTRVSDQSVEELWKTQPHLRTVVDFLGRNIAQLGVQAFERQDDGGRERVRDGLVATLMRRPNADETGYELFRALVSDLALYDNAYWLVLHTDDPRYPVEVRSIRPRWVQAVKGPHAYGVTGYQVKFPDDRGPGVTIPAENVIHFHGWNPSDARMGVSPVQTLKGVLSEQIHAARFREQLWQRGARVNAYVTRPATAPAMSAEARQKFQRQFNAAYTSDAAGRGGGVPFLDEGAELKRIGFSSKEEQFVDVAKLSLATVASVYHVNPTMVGLLDNANYSNVREFRRMLYGETLGPTIKMIEERLNAFLLPMLGIDDTRIYVEFNVDARLRGSTEEQASVASAAVGAPYMTINEYRALQNLPSVDGGDVLVQPLNVTQNGDQNPIPAAPAEDGTPEEQLMRELEKIAAGMEN